MTRKSYRSISTRHMPDHIFHIYGNPHTYAQWVYAIIEGRI